MPRFSLTWLPLVFAVLVLFPSSVSAYAPPPPPKPTPAETDAQKKAQEEQKKQAQEALKAQEIYALKSAYILLAGANNNYAGHKGPAMREVRAALILLDGDGMKQIQPQLKTIQNLNKDAGAKLLLKQSDAADVMQALSDAQVDNAAGMLNQLAVVLTANKRPKVLEHVQNALNELNAAPKHPVVLKGKEADVLTSAYILLASANHDYDGHRAKAMKAIEAASNIVEADLLKKAPVADKIKALTDANAEALEKSKAKEDPTLHESQAASDAQMLMADALLQQLAVSLNATKQQRVLNHVGTAHKEIGAALTVR
jgi:hypothetical protein